MNSFNYLLLSFYFLFFFEEILIDFGFIQPELIQKSLFRPLSGLAQIITHFFFPL